MLAVPLSIRMYLQVIHEKFEKGTETEFQGICGAVYGHSRSALDASSETLLHPTSMTDDHVIIRPPFTAFEVLD